MADSGSGPVSTAASSSRAMSSRPVAMIAASSAALSGTCLYNDGARMPSRSASRRMVSASPPCSSSSSRAALTISRGRGVSWSGMPAVGWRLLGTLLECLVHALERRQRTAVQRPDQQGDQHAAEVLLLGQANAAARQRLEREAVLTVEDARREQAAQPAQPASRHGLAHGGPERHGASADGLHANRQPLALPRDAASLGHERIPPRICVEVGQDLPDPFGRGLNVDLSAELL